MVKGGKASPHDRAADDLVVPILQMGLVSARARRAIARTRRVPGLPLLFLGVARGGIKAVTHPVPTLPWSVGLSPLSLWGAVGSDRAAQTPPALARQRPVQIGPRGAAHVERPYLSPPSSPPAAPVDRTTPGPRLLASRVGLEQVAPALALAGNLLGRARESSSGASTAQG